MDFFSPSFQVLNLYVLPFTPPDNHMRLPANLLPTDMMKSQRVYMTTIPSSGAFQLSPHGAQVVGLRREMGE